MIGKGVTSPRFKFLAGVTGRHAHNVQSFLNQIPLVVVDDAKDHPVKDGDWHYFDYLDHSVFVLEAGADGEPRFAFLNHFAASLSGLRSEDVVGKTAKEIYPGRLGQVAYEQHVRAFENGLSTTYELLLPMASSQRLLRTSLAPECGPEGRVMRVFGSSADISGEQLVDNVQLGMASIKSEMEDFISLAAHDLHAPLRNVSSIAAMLREDFQDLGDGKLELIDLLEKVGSKAMHLIGDVLSFAQLSSPGPSKAIEFDLPDLVNEILTILDPWEQSHLTCDAARIRGDRMVVQLILRNLIDNALKNSAEYLANGSLSLTISACFPEPGMFSILVQDNGHGFDNIALAFLNGGKLTADSGFGLLGVRRLVHARGGMLSASALKDGGARVEILLPGELVTQKAELTVLR